MPAEAMKLLIEPMDATPAFCEVCGKSLELGGFERCHVCNLALCLNCDIRGKLPDKPACLEHS